MSDTSKTNSRLDPLSIVGEEIGQRVELIGYWTDDREGGREEFKEWFIHPKHLVDREWAPKLRGKITEYLRCAKSVNHYLGYAYDRFNPSSGRKLGALELSDGVFMWPEGLATYVEDNLIRLPDQFLQHMIARGWDPSGHSISELSICDGRTKVYLTYWIDWCAEQKKLLGIADES